MKRRQLKTQKHGDQTEPLSVSEHGSDTGKPLDHPEPTKLTSCRAYHNTRPTSENETSETTCTHDNVALPESPSPKATPAGTTTNTPAKGTSTPGKPAKMITHFLMRITRTTKTVSPLYPIQPYLTLYATGNGTETKPSAEGPLITVDGTKPEPTGANRGNIGPIKMNFFLRVLVLYLMVTGVHGAAWDTPVLVAWTIACVTTRTAMAMNSQGLLN